MSLADRYPQEVKKILAKYPPEYKRSAVMPLLYLAQRQDGYITKTSVQDIATLLEMTTTDVVSIIGFYTLFHDRRDGKYRMQVCTDLPCALRGAEGFLEDLCSHLGIQVGGTTPDGLLTVEAVMCLAGCDRAPMFQLQTADGLEYHENMSVDKTLELIQALKKNGGEVK